MTTSTAADHVAENLRQLRRARGLTQHALAKGAGVPRPTLASIEGGGGNPTLAVLVKLAAALRVSLEELVSPPRSESKHWRASDLPTTTRGGGEIRRLVPDAIPGLTIERIELSAGGVLVGTPHTAGTREYLSCERGRIELVASEVRFDLAPGDVVCFRGDQRHSYKNAGTSVAVGFSVVIIA